jgi:arachidonate 5-lipoxygenase
LFWSALSFRKFGSLKKEKWAVTYVDFIRKYPQGVSGAIKALRRDPTSFTNLRYYCKTPFLFIGNDGIKYYAKYRVVPFDRSVQETGLQVNPCDYELSNQRVAPHNKNGRNYLKYEYENRVKREGAHYTLQIQLLMAHDDESQEVFNNMIEWDEKIYPWLDVANFSITETLDWKESTLSTFSVNNMPKSLGIIPAKSIFDYNSVNYMRAHSEIARKARLWSYKVFGMVPPIPDNDNRNSETWGK